MQYEAIIGLEIHVELKTKTKMFCSSLNDPDEKHPNMNICPICMGHPGTLPVANSNAIQKVMLVGAALNGSLARFSQFDRKNYFYPDLPKGYQISQYKFPLVAGGYLEIHNPQSTIPNKLQNADDQSTKRIRIERIHLEEDVGRLIHDGHHSLVDFNRAGVPLMELVTAPDLRSGEEIKKFGEELQRIVRYLGVSDANMEKGQMRVEVNISLRQKTEDRRQKNAFGTKVEVKNINSFKFAADAAEYEIARQTQLLNQGKKVIQETRGWNEREQKTFSQRSKEEAHDYRYFPEPDLPPLQFSDADIEYIKRALPELPQAKRERFEKEYGIDGAILETLIREKDMADYFEAAASEIRQHDKETKEKPQSNPEKLLASFLAGEMTRILKEQAASIAEIRVTPENFAELVLLVAEGKISQLAAKEALEEMFRSGGDPSDIIESRGLWQISDAGDIEDMVRHVIKNNPDVVVQYKNGKTQSLQFLVGQVMKQSRGTANPKIVQDTIKKLIA